MVLIDTLSEIRGLRQLVSKLRGCHGGTPAQRQQQTSSITYLPRMPTPFLTAIPLMEGSGCGLPQPSNAEGIDPSDIKLVYSDSVSINDAIARAQGMAVERVSPRMTLMIVMVVGMALITVRSWHLQKYQLVSPDDWLHIGVRSWTTLTTAR